MIAVADTSPLLALANLDLLHVLPLLFERALIPPAVFAEATERRPDAPGAGAIRRAVAEGVLHVTELRGATAQPTPPAWLGAGEREAIALALEVGADWLVLDDRGARRYAAGLRPSVIGTVRVLEVARDAGLLPRVLPLLERLRANGFRIGDDLIEMIWHGEADLQT